MFSVLLLPISLLRLSLPRFVDSTSPGNCLWAREFRLSRSRFCLSQTLRSPESWFRDLAQVHLLCKHPGPGCIYPYMMYVYGNVWIRLFCLSSSKLRAASAATCSRMVSAGCHRLATFWESLPSWVRNDILYYNILYYTILYYTTLHYTIPYHTILYCAILYYTILYHTILYHTILYYTIIYYTILDYTVLYYTILHYTTLYYTILYLTS